MRAAISRAADPRESRAARDELLTQVGRCREHEFGLAEPLDPDMALASATALSALAAEPARASELLDLACALEECLGFEERPAPDLALALAQCWRALPSVARFHELEPEERIRHLTLALGHAGTIRADDQRDAFGCDLARTLHDELRAAGREDEALALLTRELARFPDDLTVRPYLLGRLCDEARLGERWTTAWEALNELERAAASPAASAAGNARSLARWSASLRCQLEIAAGLVERAWLSLAEERAQLASLPAEPAARLAFLLDVSTVALATVSATSLDSALGELESALLDDGFVAAIQDEAGELVARRALLAGLREELAGGTDRTAELVAALGREALDPVHRASLALFLFRRGLERGETDARTRALDVLRTIEGGLPPDLAGARAAAGVLHALAGGELELARRLAPELSAANDVRLAALASRPERSGGFGYLTYQHRRMLSDALVRLALATGGKEHALESQLPEQALGSLARRLACTSGSVAELRALLLGPRTGLLAWLPGLDRAHLFVLDREQLAYEAVPWRYELEQAPRELADLLSSSPTRLAPAERARRLARLRELSADLARRLLPPALAARIAGYDELYVSGAEMLGVPLELLPLDGAPDGEPLGLRTPLAYLPSLPIGAALARSAARDERARPFELLLVAASTHAPEVSRRWPELVALSLSDSEQARLGVGPSGTALLGERASAAELFHALENRPPSFLHVLVHGVYDPRRELPGGLVLSPDALQPAGILWNDELLGREFTSPPLVALTACGSARGPRRFGDDGLARLGGTFLAHGARCTLQAVSDLALEPTLRLMESFTREVGRGQAPSRALLSARRELARDPLYAHPYYLYTLSTVGLGLAPVHPLESRRK